jgi:hypothetical protein
MWRKLILVPLLLIPVASVAFLVQQGIIHVTWLDALKKPAKTPLVESFRMDSAQTGKAYDIYLQLPPEYRQSTTPYPVIYSVHTRPNLIEYEAVIDPLLRRSKIPDVIVVSVSPARAASRGGSAPGPGGRPAFGGGSARARESASWLEDVTRTRQQFGKQEPTGGKAEAFVAFFEKELIPKIESEYRTVPGDRCLTGYDFGAVFVVETGLTHPDLFRRYLALAPLAEFAESATVKLAEERIRSEYDPKARMYLVMGANDYPPHLSSFQKLSDVMRSRQFKNLQFRSEVQPNPDHTSVIVPGARSGLTFLYAKP